MVNAVSEYVKRQKSPQREICAELRKIILKTFPGTKEEMRLGVPWYRGKFYVVALKDHVNLGVSVEGLTKDELALFEGRGKLMRHVKFLSEKDVDSVTTARLLKIADKSVCSCPHK